MGLNISKIDADILEALEGRGFRADRIAQMKPEKAFDEYCGWVLGDPYWGSRMRRVWLSLSKAESEPQ